MGYTTMVCNAVHEYGMTSPASTPGMTDSRSSKSSSLTSVSSDGGSIHDDAGDFEDIGLEDGVRSERRAKKPEAVVNAGLLSPDFRPQSKHMAAPRTSRDVRKHAADLVWRPRNRPKVPFLQTQNLQRAPTGLGLFLGPHTSPPPLRHPLRSSSQVSDRRQPRSPLTLEPPLVRRSSWQTNRERKTALQLELECDQDDEDDIPDGLVLDNVPISPRPPQVRARSQPGSSPKRTDATATRIRSVGNGTPPVAQAQGCLRSPTWKSDTAVYTLGSRPTSPMMTRAKSWNMALADLSAEAKALTEKLEEHAEELSRSQRSSTGSMPTTRPEEAKPRVRSALAELPPLRRTNVMIDPLPVSKEKEAVLSRTRPSWLPPKNPAEERRHLKEYQKMMAHSVEAERRREEAKRARSDCRDTAVDSIMHMWEDDIVPRWNVALRERRNRELWWLGIAPRSRGTVWRKAIGNVLRLTEASFRAALGRAQDAKARVQDGNGTADDARYSAWFAAIEKEVEECTWPELRIFQKGGPLHQALRDVLSAYAMYRSDIGYVPGCNTIAAVLLLNLPSPSDAFIALANMLNRPLPLSFYACDAGAKVSAYDLLMQKLYQTSPALHQHLRGLPHHDADLYLDDLFTGLFSRHLALDEVTRLWDVYVFEGDGVLIRAGVALLVQKEMSLLGTKSTEEVKAILGGAQDSRRTLTSNGADDRWMRAVRQVGKV